MLDVKEFSVLALQFFSKSKTILKTKVFKREKDSCKQLKHKLQKVPYHNRNIKSLGLTLSRSKSYMMKKSKKFTNDMKTSDN